MPIQKNSRYAERGQALFETLIALPLMLVSLFAIIYFSRLGVVSERTQYAVRYGAEIADPADLFSEGYLALFNAQNGSILVPSPCSQKTKDQTKLAITLAETGPSSLASAQQYWSPDHGSTADCVSTKRSFVIQQAFISSLQQNQYGQFSGSHQDYGFISHILRVAQLRQITATGTVGAPSYIAPIFAGAQSTTSATFYWAAPVSPAIILACIASGPTGGGGGNPSPPVSEIQAIGQLMFPGRTFTSGGDPTNPNCGS